jgi:hypothetical protein
MEKGDWIKLGGTSGDGILEININIKTGFV